MGCDVKVFLGNGNVAGPKPNLLATAPIHPMPAGSRKRFALAALVPSVALAGVLLALLPGFAQAAPSIDTGLVALKAPRVATSAWLGADQAAVEPAKIVVAEKGGRLLKNGTRSREGSEEGDAARKPASADAPAAGPTSAKAASQAPAAAAPAPASGPTKAAASTPDPTGPVVDPTRSTTPLTGTGANTGTITCVANCNRPAAAPAVTGGSIECVAGCAGLQSATSRQTASTDASSSMQASSGSAGGKITVMRGNTRVKAYSDGR